jgi:GNAT superfamily N-acetyltransferase
MRRWRGSRSRWRTERVRRELAGGFELDDDPQRIDVDAVHTFISGESYWGQGRSRERVERAIRGSRRVVGLYRGGEQVGFARAISDGVILAYLADVYVLSVHRGRGLGLELVREIVDGARADEISPNARWLLHTADAQGLYAKLGFGTDPPTYTFMERGRAPASGDRASAPSPE